MKMQALLKIVCLAMLLLPFTAQAQKNTAADSIRPPGKKAKSNSLHTVLTSSTTVQSGGNNPTITDTSKAPPQKSGVRIVPRNVADSAKKK
jgi:hypothetical protein